MNLPNVPWRNGWEPCSAGCRSTIQCTTIPSTSPPPPPPEAIAEDAGEGSSGGEEGVEAPPDDLAAAGLNGVPADSEAAEEEPVAAQEREAAATSGGEAIEAAVGAGPRIAARTKIIPVVVPEARDAAPVVYSKAEDAPPETPPPPSIERTGVEREERDQPVATEGLAADTSETVQQTSASEATSAPIAPIAPTPEESAPEAAMADAPPSILVTVPYQLSAANEGASDLVGVERGTRGIPCYEFLGRRAPCRPCVAGAAHLQGSIATARVAGESGCDYLITSTQLVGSDPPRFIEQIEEAPALREPDPVADLPPWPPIDDAPADSEEVAPAAELGSGVEPFDEPTPEVTIEELDGFEDEDPPRPALDELAEAESYLLDEALPSAAPDGRPREPNASVETAPFRPIEAPAGPRHPWLRNVMAGLLGAALIAFGYRWATQGEEAPVLPPGAIELDLPPELVAELESRTDAWNRPGAIALDSVGVAVPTAEPRQAPDTPPATPPDAGPEAIVEEPPVAAADPDPQTPDTEADPPPVLAESGAAQPVGPRIDSPFANWVAYEVALEFLERGDLSGAADAWDAMLESEPKSNSTLMLETNCEEWAAKENLKRFTGDTAAILKPIYIEGRKCFLLAYGSFANEAEANAAIDRLPEPFRSRSTRPIIRSFNLLP